MFVKAKYMSMGFVNVCEGEMHKYIHYSDNIGGSFVNVKAEIPYK